MKDVSSQEAVIREVMQLLHRRIESGDPSTPDDEYRPEAVQLVTAVAADPQPRESGRLASLTREIFSESFGERYDPDMFADFEDDLSKIFEKYQY